MTVCDARLVLFVWQHIGRELVNPISDGTKSRDFENRPLTGSNPPNPRDKNAKRRVDGAIRTVYPTNHSVRDPMNLSICMSLILVDKIKQKIQP